MNLENVHLIGQAEFQEHKISNQDKINLLFSAVFGTFRNGEMKDKGLANQIIELAFVIFGGDIPIENSKGEDTKNPLHQHGMVDQIKDMIKAHNEVARKMSEFEGMYIAIARAAKIKPEKLAKMMFENSDNHNFEYELGLLVKDKLDELKKEEEAKKAKWEKEKQLEKV